MAGKLTPEMKEAQWGKGQSGNPKGRKPGTGYKPVSHIRRTLAKLRAMEEQALQNIEDSVTRKDIDKEALATAKWLITTMVTLNRAAIADEQLSFNVKAYNEEKEEAKKEGTTGNILRPRFSTKMLSDDASDDEEE